MPRAREHTKILAEEKTRIIGTQRRCSKARLMIAEVDLHIRTTDLTAAEAEAEAGHIEDAVVLSARM